MSRVMTYLNKKDHERFTQVCEKEDCTPYMLFKKAVLDHIYAYPLEKAPDSENGVLKQDLGEEAVTEVPEPETPIMDAEEVQERVRKILKGE